MNQSHEITLTGCKPEPLMSYLKALGVFRIVSEQADHGAQAGWKMENFVIQSKYNRNELEDFMVNKYEPSPILVPWSGNDFFGISGSPIKSYKKTPTGSSIIEAFYNASTQRLAPYKRAIQEVLETFKKTKIHSKAEMEKNKHRFLSVLRSNASNDVVNWIDCAVVIFEKSNPFSALLGSGGGSDGNTHFSDNFMQNLWEMLPDFDEQRHVKGKSVFDTTKKSTELLRNALWGIHTDSLVSKRTSALFDAAAVGGPNATQGMNRESLSNPWNIILLFEGCIAFSGTLGKRLNTKVSSKSEQMAAFPFQFRPSLNENNNMVDKEKSGRELWLPIWDQMCHYYEFQYFLTEGRADVGQRGAQYGVDMAMAAASLGVDRGISSFIRYLIVKGSVGGDNYNTTALLGKFQVSLKEKISLILEFVKKLNLLRRSLLKDETPERLKIVYKKVESAIYDYCRNGHPEDIQRLLLALGKVEQELAVTGGKRSGKEICRPLGGLTTEWLTAVDDQSVEFSIALSLAGMNDLEGKVPPIRSNLEPVKLERFSWVWQGSAPQVVWNSFDLCSNMAAVLARRMMDGTKVGCKGLPLQSVHTLSLETISLFLSGETSDTMIQSLLWGLILINHKQKYPSNIGRSHFMEMDCLPLPREYALLKLVFLPRPLVCEWNQLKEAKTWRLARNNEEGILIRPEPRVLQLLTVGRVEEACRIAHQRLHVSGFKPLPGPNMSGISRDNEWETSTFLNPQRLAASLLLPISNFSIQKLITLVTRQDKNTEFDIHV
jgi:CRISPR-associated protein Csx17